jgi:hypothetical protein
LHRWSDLRMRPNWRASALTLRQRQANLLPHWALCRTDSTCCQEPRCWHRHLWHLWHRPASAPKSSNQDAINNYKNIINIHKL